jgi:hypothetical protein
VDEIASLSPHSILTKMPAGFLAVGSWLTRLLRFIPAAGRLVRPNISGRWFFEYAIKKSAYNPYKGMRVQYVAQLLCDKNGIVSGTSEKTRDRVSSDEIRTYTGKHRDKAEIQGQVTYSFSRFSWAITLHIREQGHLREHSATQILFSYDAGKKLKGKFTGTAADSEGEVFWSREAFLNL